MRFKKKTSIQCNTRISQTWNAPYLNHNYYKLSKSYSHVQVPAWCYCINWRQYHTANSAWDICSSGWSLWAVLQSLFQHHGILTVAWNIAVRCCLWDLGTAPLSKHLVLIRKCLYDAIATINGNAAAVPSLWDIYRTGQSLSPVLMSNIPADGTVAVAVDISLR